MTRGPSSTYGSADSRPLPGMWWCMLSYNQGPLALPFGSGVTDTAALAAAADGGPKLTLCGCCSELGQPRSQAVLPGSADASMASERLPDTLTTAEGTLPVSRPQSRWLPPKAALTDHVGPIALGLLSTPGLNPLISTRRHCQHRTSCLALCELPAHAQAAALEPALVLQAATEDAGSWQSSLTGLAKPPANTGSKPESKDSKAAAGTTRKPRGMPVLRAAMQLLTEDAANRAADACLHLGPLHVPVTAGSCKLTGHP